MKWGEVTLKDLDHRTDKIRVKHGRIQGGEAFRRRRQRVKLKKIRKVNRKMYIFYSLINK